MEDLLSATHINLLKETPDEGAECMGDGMFVLSEEDTLHKMIVNQPFHSDNFTILLVSGGELAFKCNLASYSLEANNIFFVLPGSLFELRYISPDISFTALVFSKDYLVKQGVHMNNAETLHLFSAEVQLQYLLSEQECNDLRIAIFAMHKKTKLPSGTPFLNEIVRYSFLALLYDVSLIFYRHNAVREIRLNRKEALTSGFLKLLSTHFKKERSVQYYADALFITARHLSHVVKEITGKTAGALIDEAVIREAKMLLFEPLMTVAHAADILEFSNQSFFGKYFKNHTGVSPSEYRAASRAGQNPPF